MVFIFHSYTPVNCSYQLGGRAAVDESIYENTIKKFKSAKIIIRLLVFNRILKMLRNLKNIFSKKRYRKNNFLQAKHFMDINIGFKFCER